MGANVRISQQLGHDGSDSSSGQQMIAMMVVFVDVDDEAASAATDCRSRGCR